MMEQTEIKDFVTAKIHAEGQEEDVFELVSQEQEEARYKNYSADDIVLVRVTSVLPEKGVIKPICKVPFVIKTPHVLSYIISDMVKERFSGNVHDPNNWEEINRQVQELTPLATQYRSTVHFSLNSLVQDHGAFQNIFDGQYIIIEPLNEQLSKTQFASIRGEDTFTQDSVELSQKASILMSESEYSKIPYEKREELNENMSIYCYTGDRDTAFKMLLMQLGYVPEEIQAHGFQESETSLKIEEAIGEIASEYNIDRSPHRYSEQYQKDDEINLKVVDLHSKSYMKFLFSNIQISAETKKEILETKLLITPWQLSEKSVSELKATIEKLGLDEYKKIVEVYNKSIEEMIRKGTFPTNEEIFDSEELKIDGLERELSG